MTNDVCLEGCSSLVRRDKDLYRLSVDKLFLRVSTASAFLAVSVARTVRVTPYQFGDLDKALPELGIFVVDFTSILALSYFTCSEVKGISA